MPEVPQHIAIIMDGNRRWAKAHHLPNVSGHREGFEALERIGDHCLKIGVKFLTVYAFSTENWNRSKLEVRYLMNLMRFVLTRKLRRFAKRGMQLRFLGRLTDLPKDLQRLIDRAVETTKQNRRGVLNIALNYGGRIELVDAVKRIVAKGLRPSQVNEAAVESSLYTAGEPDPELVIRTGGQQRLSNYLPWQSVYSELYFTPKFWPDFGPADLDAAIEDFQRRKRNFGK